MSVNSYSKVDAVEQKDMVNSGVRGNMDRRTQDRGGLYYCIKYCYGTVRVSYNTRNLLTDLPYHIQVPSTGNL